MDTIIYFYKKRELQQPVLTIEKKKGYRLVRVAVCGGEDCWFGQSLTETPEKPEAEPDAPIVRAAESGIAGRPSKSRAGQDGKDRKAGTLTRLWESLCLRRSEDRRRRREKQEALRRQKYMEEKLQLVERQLTELTEEIWAQTEELDTCSCVYAGGADRLLQGNGMLAQLWKNVWDVREFVDYRTFRWASYLLPYVSHFRFVVLGTAPCAQELIKSCARRMKSLRWIVRERDCEEELLEFVEEFYEDYGLAATLQTVEGRNGFRGLCMETVEPVCVLDFTEEVRFFWGGLEPDSVWLDFSSLEEKERRMERLAPSIRYYSLKKLWSGRI